jgi:hypothetical protein
LGKIFNFYKNPVNLIKQFFFNIFRFLIVKKSDAIITNGLRDSKIIKSIHTHKKIFEIPYAINSKKYNLSKNKNIIIGIPGSIDPLRRDYFKILDLFHLLIKIKKKIKIIFIGSYQSNTIKNKKNLKSNYFNELSKKVDELKAEGFNITLFKNKLSQKIYNKCLKESDVIFTHMNYKSYNPSKAQGWTSSYTEAITYNKILLTNRINPPKNIRSIELSYKNEKEFYKKIINILKNKKKISNRVNKNIKKYFGKKNISKLLNYEINKIIN